MLLLKVVFTKLANLQAFMLLVLVLKYSFSRTCMIFLSKALGMIGLGYMKSELV